MTATGTAAPPLRRTLADVLVPSAAHSLVMDAALVIVGAALTAGAAQVAFHAPWSAVPYTLQTGSVLLVGTALGSRRGALSMALYVAAGAIGLPVYSAGASGVTQLFGFTGGYLAGFVLAAALVGWLAERGWDRSPWRMFALMAVGTLVIYAVGVPVLAAVLSMPGREAIESGAVVFLPWDALKALAAAGLLPLAWRLTGSR